MTSDPFIAAIADFELLPFSGCVVELDGTISAVNVATTRLVGRPREQIVGRMAWDFAPGADLIWPEIVASARAGEAHGEITLATLSGPRAVHYIATVRTHDERCVVLLFSFETTRGDGVALLMRAESLGLVAGGIAHDFNNQLVSVLAEASALREEANLDDRVRDSLRRIEAAAQRMALSTRQLLAYAGRGRFVSEMLDPDEVVAGLHDHLQRVVRAGATLSVSTGATRCAIHADRSLLREVVTNLVINASESLASAGGKVEVATSLLPREGAPAWWRLEVSDDGSGMDARTAARMYDPFFTTKADRHGLGLSAVHGIVRRLGGEISVDSERDRGTRFQVRIPTIPSARPVRAVPRTASERATSLRDVRILVADDEPSVRSTIRRILERRGATVVTADDGGEAEARLAQGTYELVLLDVMMPKRTGFQLLPIARTLQPDARVMLMSGYSDGERGGGTAEPDAFLEKPFTAKQMDEAIDAALANRPR